MYLHAPVGLCLSFVFTHLSTFCLSSSCVNCAHFTSVVGFGMTIFLIPDFLHLGLLITSTVLTTNSSAIGHTILNGLHNWAAKGDEDVQHFHDGVTDDKCMELRLFSDTQAEAFGARTLDGSPSVYYYCTGAENESFVISSMAAVYVSLRRSVNIVQTPPRARPRSGSRTPRIAQVY